VDHTPPPFFKRGPAPLVRLFFFATLSLALLVIDARFRYVEGLRSWLALAAYPLQRAALAPFEVGERVAGYFSTQARLVAENEQLRAKALEYSQDAQRFQAAQAEAAELRRIINAGERLDLKTIPAEVLYASRIRTRTRSSSTAARSRASSPAARRVIRRHRPGDPRPSFPRSRCSPTPIRQCPAGGARPARHRLRRRRPGMLELRFTAATRGTTATSSSRPALTAPTPPGCRSRPWCTSSATPITLSRAYSAGRRPAWTAAATCW
jgi:hypothetical protein